MWWHDSERTTPRKAKGGIKALSQRGAFGTTWWGNRWVDVLESFDVAGRLLRGRSYARSGQVLTLEVAAGAATATVQGSERKPYDVEIAVRPWTAAQQKALLDAVAGSAALAAKLLAGELPTELEAVVKAAGAPLFPERRGDIAPGCSCPDSSVPCKHIAAVYYLLAEEFDREPFLLFRLRGLERKALFGRLNLAPKSSARPAGEPLLSDASFWRGAELPADLLADARRPDSAAGLPKRLGPVPFWRGEERFQEAMESMYAAASTAAARRLES